MLDILTLLFRFAMRSRMQLNPFVAVVRMSISQERPSLGMILLQRLKS